MKKNRTAQNSTENQNQNLDSPSEVAKRVGLSLETLIADIEHTSRQSLSNAKKRTPNKYEAILMGSVAIKLGITIEDMIYLAKLKEMKND
ncbi:hypothetical protein [Poseidonibacter ostreae]|uniref:Uncharacterized protein n=1 Tax=Poseidonibacter ostreae TaxID=2654171 RepID=A0A6L4WWW7_9BACT|nr:hypothetical protein [Poseidonibacter ostreae]KAB7891335.1 hypothetical protein GBG19_00430 [Poseidonibacter ostreae]